MVNCFHKKVYLFNLLLLLFSASALSQRPFNEIMASAVAAKDKQLPGLGMQVVSEEDDKKVLISKTGRYVVKGTVIDMWDGIKSSDTMPLPYPNLPAQLDWSDFAVSFGSPSNQEVISYVSFSCLQCEDVIKQLLSDSFLSKYFVRILILSNNDDDRLIAENVFCAKDKQQQFKSLFLQRDLSYMDKDCQHSQPQLNISLANAQHIMALPSTYIKNTGRAYLGKLPTF